MTELNEQVAVAGNGYFTSHPFLSTAVEVVGAEAIVDINTAVGAVHQATSHLVSPCYDPRAIYN